MDIKDNENPEMKDKIGLGEYASFGAGSIGIIMLNSVLVSYLMIYMTNVAIMSPNGTRKA